MPTASNVVATTPFLTVEQVAAELGITPLGVRRLIALKLLAANRMVAETGEWKIMPVALERYAASDRKRMLMPALDAGWFNDTSIRFRANLCEDAIRSVMYANIPAECPIENKSKTNQLTSQSVGMDSSVHRAIVAVARETAKWEERRILESPGTRIPNQGTAFLVAELSRRTFNAVTKVTKIPVTDANARVAALYDSPESYRRYVDAGWKNFADFNTQFSVSRQYPNGVMVNFGVPHTVLTTAIGLSTVEPLTF